MTPPDIYRTLDLLTASTTWIQVGDIDVQWVTEVIEECGRSI